MMQIMGGIGSGNKPKDAEAKRIALALLRAGLCSPAELVDMAGMERSTVHRWPNAEGLNWKEARRQMLVKLWRREAKYGVTKLV